MDEGCPPILIATYPTSTTWNQFGDRQVVCIRSASLNLEVGDYIAYSERVQWVRRSRPHDAEALDQFDVSRVAYPGEEALLDYANQNYPTSANWYL